MPQNINALLCFAEQYEVMKNEIIQTGRFGLDGESLMNLFAYWIGGAANSFLIRVDWFDSSIRTVFMFCSTYCCKT
ncbi:hypothetical protein DXC71_09210 [Bifidobacterium pseudocatenulatum]|nr:hypothetical protein DXC71_09210 [Bifidobacterium pseudocatenulatum]